MFHTNKAQIVMLFVEVAVENFWQMTTVDAVIFKTTKKNTLKIASMEILFHRVLV